MAKVIESVSYRDFPPGGYIPKKVVDDFIRRHTVEAEHIVTIVQDGQYVEELVALELSPGEEAGAQEKGEHDSQ